MEASNRIRTRPRARTLGAAVALTGVIAACSSGGGEDASTDPTTEDTASADVEFTVSSVEVETDPTFRIGARGEPYRVVYLLEDLLDDDVALSTEVVTVRAPFDSVLEDRNGTPPGGEVTLRQIATFDRLAIGGPEAPVVVHRVPGPTPSDLRLAPILDDAVEAGLIELREQREVADVRCQVVRSGTLLGAGPLVAITADEFADTCVDADGILREETLFLDGRPTLRRAAIEAGPIDVTDEDFDAGPVVAPVDQGGGSVLAVEPSVGAVGPFWELEVEAVPEGFALQGRWAVIPPQPENFSDPQRADSIVAGTVDVYVDGADVVVVYQGATRGGLRAFRAHPAAHAVDAGELGAADLLLSASGSEVRAADGGRFVHVMGTVDADTLLGVARGLTRTEGTGLVYLDR